MDIKGDLKKAAGAVAKEILSNRPSAVTQKIDPKTGKPYPTLEAGAGGAKKAVAKVVESFSHRGSELSKAERTAIREQNAAANTMKSKDLDAVERGQKGAESRKLGEEQKQEYAYNKGQKVGAVKGAAATAATAIALAALEKKKGSQPDHHVTDNNNHTKPVK